MGGWGGGMEFGMGGGGGWLYTYRYTVTIGMTSALRWAAMRAILMFHNWEGPSHKTVSTDHNFWRERTAEADSNWGPSAYQPNNASPLGQTASHTGGSSPFSKKEWVMFPLEVNLMVHGTLRAPLSGTFLQRKDVVNQCLEFGSTAVALVGWFIERT